MLRPAAHPQVRSARHMPGSGLSVYCGSKQQRPAAYSGIDQPPRRACVSPHRRKLDSKSGIRGTRRCRRLPQILASTPNLQHLSADVQRQLRALCRLVESSDKNCRKSSRRIKSQRQTIRLCNAPFEAGRLILIEVDGVVADLKVIPSRIVVPSNI